MLIQKKICLLGDFSVGKTSLVRRFVEGEFDDKYLSTLGAKVNRKTLNYQHEQPTELKLLIWDIAGGEKFDMMMRSYYNGSSGAILICDLTRPETLDSLDKYIHNFWNINPDTPFVIAGNKADLIEDNAATMKELDKIATQNQMAYFITSAKTGQNVESLFHRLGELLLSN
ncbi:MAG: GTP-binding protein [Anaerolineaceae bacterium 4572_78]|nr:MAG: GTP-binding protein [Anaerolineaceae bacterium 4572_78]